MHPARASAADFDWRLSIATVDSDADFSRLVGVDRSLMALSATGLSLVDEDRLVHLGAYETYEFAGERAVASAQVYQSTLDLNLMTRLAVGTAAVSR